MKSSARVEPLWIGCQHSTGRLKGPRHEGQFFQRVAAVGYLRRQCVVPALVRKGFLVEGLEDDVDLLFKQLAVGLLVTERRAEGLDLARVIAATDAKHNAAAG